MKPHESKPLGAITNEGERIKASIRSKVEHPFRVIKRQVGFVKVHYRGLKKNTTQLTTLFSPSNLWMACDKLLEGQASVRLLRRRAARNGLKGHAAAAQTPDER